MFFTQNTPPCCTRSAHDYFQPIDFLALSDPSIMVATANVFPRSTGSGVYRSGLPGAVEKLNWVTWELLCTSMRLRSHANNSHNAPHFVEASRHVCAIEIPLARRQLCCVARLILYSNERSWAASNTVWKMRPSKNLTSSAVSARLRARTSDFSASSTADRLG
jgi:hypothetical protein